MIGLDDKTIRSLLFAPGSDARKLSRALASDADAVVADLEDAVPSAGGEKARARALVAETFAEEPAGGPARFVRFNGADTPFFGEDLDAVAELPLSCIVLPKATPEAVAALGAAGPPVVAIVETAAGLRLAHETASNARVAALMLGAADLGAELRLEPRPDGLEILYARSALVVDSAAAGIGPPVDVVHLDVHDAAGLETEARLARSLGFGAKACIHPEQVPVVNRVFSPTEAEVEWAHQVLEAYARATADGRGAILVRGALVDFALVRRAETILSESEEA